MEEKQDYLQFESKDEITIWMRRVFANKKIWKQSYPTLVNILSLDDKKVVAKSLFIIGEIGLKYPDIIDNRAFEKILTLMKSEDAQLRERAVHAFGRIGKGNDEKVKPYIENLLLLGEDKDENVRMNVIWASENIAVNNEKLFENYMSVFAKLLDDNSAKVRMEAPEIFRLIGKKNSKYIYPYEDKLEKLSREDKNTVVRIHAREALKTLSQYKVKNQ